MEMKKTSIRTIAEVKDLLERRHVNRQLQLSLGSISKELGYSPTTVQRALAQLEADGIIQICREGRSRTEAQTIVLLNSGDDFSSVVAEMRHKAEENHRLIMKFMEATVSEIQRLKKEQAKWARFNERIKSRSVLDDKYEIITVALEDDEEQKE